ncbi:hypothetical protein PIB30_077729 [Stylosanthes scabra]|uniref:Uncharacterized protein n=1 Tax=Stylosanthes scabra TaxID=79078 RepID=A0ABU6QQC0_9FABA|nr:hypothetical protein [Stylosanthes scabra]
MDDTTELKQSFSSVRILIDLNVWNFIHEWVTLEEGDRKFEVYVREFGREIFSAQTHPRTYHEVSLAPGDSSSLQEEDRSSRESEEMVHETAGMEDDDTERKVADDKVDLGQDPRIEEIKMEKCEEGVDMGVVVRAVAKKELLEEGALNETNDAFNKEISNNFIWLVDCKREDEGVNNVRNELSISGPSSNRGEGPITNERILVGSDSSSTSQLRIGPCAYNGHFQRAQSDGNIRPLLAKPKQNGREDG